MNTTDATLRPLAVGDINRLCEIDPDWTPMDFLEAKSTCEAQAATIKGYVVGFILWQINTESVQIVRVATDGAYHGSVLTLLMEFVQNIAIESLRPSVLCRVYAENVCGNDILRQYGFKAAGLDRECGEWIMECRV